MIGCLAIIVAVVTAAAVGYRVTGSRRGEPPSGSELRWFEILGRYAPYDPASSPAPDDDPAFHRAGPRRER